MHSQWVTEKDNPVTLPRRHFCGDLRITPQGTRKLAGHLQTGGLNQATGATRSDQIEILKVFQMIPNERNQHSFLSVVSNQGQGLFLFRFNFGLSLHDPILSAGCEVCHGIPFKNKKPPQL